MATETTTRIIEIRATYADALKGIADYTKKLEEAKEAEKALRQAIKESGEATDEDRKQLAAIKQVQDECRRAVSDLTKEMQNNAKVEKAQEGSLVSLRAQLSNATKDYDALSREERNGAKGVEMRDHINEITNELKKAEEGTQRFQRNVGNYENAITSAISGGNPFIAQLLQMTKGADSAKGAMQNVTAGVQSFGKSLLSLLANPIVAVIAGIAAVVMTVAKAIKSSEEQTNRLNAVLAPLQRALQAVMSVLQKFAGLILSAVEGAMKLADAIGKWAEKLPLVGKYLKKVNDANREAIGLEQRDADLVRQTREDRVQDAKDELEVSRLRNEVAKKDQYTAEERLAMLEQAERLEADIAKREYDRAKEEYDIALAKSKRAENSAEELDRLAELEAAMYKAEERYNDKTRRMETQMATLRKEIADDEQKRIDERAKAYERAAQEMEQRLEAETEDVRKATDARLALITDGYERERAQEEESYARSLAALQERLDTDTEMTVAQREAVQSQVESLTEAHNRKLAELDAQRVAEQVAAAYQAEQDILAMRIELSEQGSQEQLDLQMEQLQREMEQRLEAEDLTDEQILLIRDVFHKRMDDLQIAYDQRQAQEAERAAQEQERIESEKQSALRSISQSATAILDEYAEQSKAAAVASKAITLAQIAVDTGKAISEGIASAMSVPFPGNIAAIATTIAAVMANIATAVSTVKGAKFAEGGVVSGPGTGTSDSVPAMLSNGESVNTALATAMFSPLYSALNQIGGGEAYTGGGGSEALGEEMLARAFERGASRITPVVSVEEISRVTDRVRVIESMGRA